MTAIGALLLGVLIGLSLGALGGGGSILAVPALVYLLGETAHQATTSSLVIVGTTAAAATVGQARAGRVQWKAGAAFGACGIAASFLGSYLNRMLEPNVLLLAFAGLMLVAAAAMLLQLRAPATAPAPARERVTLGAPSPGLPSETRDPTSARRATTIGKIVIAGLIVGFLTGLLGVGGGFVIVPALTVALRYPMPTAIGTSLLVIAINSAAALVARVGHESFHWTVIVPFAIAAIIGSVAGKQIADRMTPDSLTRAFAVFMIFVAAYVGIRSGTAL